MDRADKLGLGLAVGGHVVLFGLLSSRFLSAPTPDDLVPTPVEVSLVEEVAPVSSAPDPQVVARAPEAPTEGRPDAGEIAPQPLPPAPLPPAPLPPLAAPPPPPVPARVTPRPTPPAPRPSPRANPRPSPPAPKATPRPAPPSPRASRKPTPPSPRASPRPSPPAPARAVPSPPAPAASKPGPSGASRLGKDFLSGVGAAASGSAKASGAVTGAEKKAINVSINAAVRGPWNGCSVSGADIDELKTTIRFSLSSDGGLSSIDSVRTTGENANNKPQVDRFEECAKRAIRLAAPFDLPRDSYSAWKSYTLDFNKR